MEPDIELVKITLTRHCIGCDFTSIDVDVLNNHINEVCQSVNPNQWTCPNCQATYITKITLDNHLLNDHYDTCLKYVSHHYYQCDLCDYKDILKFMVLSHMERKIQQTNFECYFCPQIFNCKKDLLVHFNNHSVRDDFLYKCSVCNFLTYYKQSYDFHILSNPVCRPTNLKFVTRCQDHVA